MKRIGLILVSIILTVFITSCGGQKPQPAPAPAPTPEPAQAARIQVFVVQQSISPTPAWVSKKWEIGKDEEGNKVIFITVEAQRDTKEKAEAEAKGNLIEMLAEMIKQVATTEFAIAKQGMLNDSSDLDTYFEQTIAAVSKNVNIGGSRPFEDYWEYLQEVQGGASKTYYRFVKRYVLDYTIYQKLLKNAWEPVAKKIPPELKDKADKVLEGINKGLE